MTINCATCSRPFHATPSRVAKGKRFCSIQCRDASVLDARNEQFRRGIKRCGKCHTEKALTEFYTQGTKRRGLDGRAGWCKECRRSDERNRRADMSNVRKFHARYESDMEFRARELLRAIGKRTRRFGIPFDLDITWLAERLRSGRCELSGVRFDFSCETRRPKALTPSIDRIIPGGGYTKDNCRVIAFALNAAFQNFGLDAFLPIAEGLVDCMSARRSA